MPAERRKGETFAPLVNFTITTADRIRAANGPPAYMRRRRHIEDIEGFLRAEVDEALARAGRRAEAGGNTEAVWEAARAALEGRVEIVKALRELNRLIDAHNRYYPIEANLRLDPVSRRQLDRGRPWEPLPTVTLSDVLFACGAPSHVGKIT